MQSLEFIYNGVKSSTFGVLGSPSVPLLPTRRTNLQTVSRRDGAYDMGHDSYEQRVIQMDCMIKANTPATLLRNLALVAEWLSGSGYLILGRDETKRWKAKVYEGIDLIRAAQTGRFMVTFLCDPWAEDVTEQTEPLTGAAADYGSQVKFYPTIKVVATSPIVTYRVTLLSTGEYVLLEGLTVGTGGILQIDMATGKVLHGDLIIMTKVNRNSTFFEVPPGSQTITVSPTGHIVTMMYRRRYRYA